MRVKVVHMGGESQVYDLEEGATVMDALREANLPTSGIKINVNGKEASTPDLLADRDVVIAATKVAGG